jgi:hypothetical protein
MGWVKVRDGPSVFGQARRGTDPFEAGGISARKMLLGPSGELVDTHSFSVRQHLVPEETP